MAAPTAPGVVTARRSVPTRAPAPGGEARAPAAAPRRDSVGAVGRRAGVHLLVIVGYACFGLALWWHVWDGHLASSLTCACGDAGQAAWFVAWPAHALAHGLDPFFSSALDAPRGLNLLDNASTTAIGLALAPLTLTAGPIAATNVALTLAPALSSWACWLACRRLVRWKVAPLVAGLLFGYSPFVVTNLALGHLGLAFLVVPPLLVLATSRLLFGDPARTWRAGLGIGALLALQFFVSSEILVVLVVVGFPVTVLAALAGRSKLVPPARLLAGLAAAGALASVLLAVPVWFALAGPQHLTGRLWESAPIDGNALSAFVEAGRFGSPAPTLMKLGGYEGLRGPPAAYVGPFVLGLASLALLVAWRRRTTWVLAATTVLAGALSLGALLFVSPGHATSLWTPWRLFGTVPLLDDVIPQRFSALIDLGVALLAAVGLDGARDVAARLGRHLSTRAGARAARTVLVRAVPRAGGAFLAVLAALAVGSWWWTYQVPLETSLVHVPRWYSTAAPRLPAGSVVVSVPFPLPADATSGPMVWQALDGMRFRLAGGYAKSPGPRGAPLTLASAPQAERVLARLSGAAAGPLPAGTAEQVAAVRRALGEWGASYVVVTRRSRAPARAVAIIGAALGSRPKRTEGAWVWALPRPKGPVGARDAGAVAPAGGARRGRPTPRA